MRSREMIAKLERLEPDDDDEVKVWDLSLLSPEDQDRAHQLMDMIGEFDEQTGLTPKLRAAIAEFEDLVRDLPLLGRDDEMQGPSIRVPHDLDTYWSWRQPSRNWRSLDFNKLTKVQTVRFVQLCEQYGYVEGERNQKSLMLPLEQWQRDDRADLQAMLDRSK